LDIIFHKEDQRPTSMPNFWHWFPIECC